jgi:hypothetical protein
MIFDWKDQQTQQKNQSHCSWFSGMHSDSSEYKVRVPLGWLTRKAKLSTNTIFNSLGPTAGALSSATQWTPINHRLSHMFCSHVSTNRNLHIVSTEMLTKPQVSIYAKLIWTQTA